MCLPPFPSTPAPPYRDVLRRVDWEYRPVLDIWIRYGPGEGEVKHFVPISRPTSIPAVKRSR